MDTLSLARELIRRPSVSPADAGCQTLIAELLEQAGLHGRAPEIRRGRQPLGTARPRGAGARLRGPHGRRAERTARAVGRRPVRGDRAGRQADRPRRGRHERQSRRDDQRLSPRSSRRYPQIAGSIGLLITSDEEGAADDGTLKVMETLASRGETFQYCVVGEPSSAAQARRHGPHRPARQPVRAS